MSTEPEDNSITAEDWTFLERTYSGDPAYLAYLHAIHPAPPPPEPNPPVRIHHSARKRRYSA